MVSEDGAEIAETSYPVSNVQNQEQIDKLQAALLTIDRRDEKKVSTELFGTATKKRIEKLKDKPEFLQQIKIQKTLIELAIARNDLESVAELSALNHYDARVDTLTGLPNRLGIEEKIDTLFDNLDREPNQNEEVFLLYGDGDGLKATNHDQSREEGDKLLIAIGEELVSAANGRLVGKTGSDEYAMICVGCSEEKVRKIALSVQDGLEKRKGDDGLHEKAGISFGIAKRLPKETAKELVFRADEAMKEAKDALVKNAGDRTTLGRKIVTI